MTRRVQCPDCWGAGWLNDDGEPVDSIATGCTSCGTCGGTGELLEEVELPRRSGPRIFTGD